MRVTNNPEEIGNCGCGRSPNGKCIGWHGLNDQQLQEARRLWNERQEMRARSGSGALKSFYKPKPGQAKSSAQG